MTSGKSIDLKKKFTFDTFGRYAIIKDIIERNRNDSNKKLKILDVGARENVLKKFLPYDSVYYLDPFVSSICEDFIKGDGCDMPLKSQSFDWVVSTDVLEHVSMERRLDFLKEMIRVSEIGVVLAAPFYSVENEKAECDVNEYYKSISDGNGYIWLREHIENGLPSNAEIEDFLKKEGYSYQKIKHNDLELWRQFLKLTLNAIQHDAVDILSDFNYFYNEEIFPFDHGDNSYRTFYFIKKGNDLKEIEYEKNDIKQESLLECYKRGFELQNKLAAISSKKNNELELRINDLEIIMEEMKYKIKEKNRELILLKSSKFWKLRDNYLFFRNKLEFIVKSPDKFVKKYLKVSIDAIKFLLPKSFRRKFGHIYNTFFLEGNKPTQDTFSLGEFLQSTEANKQHWHNILHFSVIDWEMRFQRPQQIDKIFADKDNRIFYIATKFIKAPKNCSKKEIKSLVRIKEISKNIYEVFLVSEKEANIYCDCATDEDIKYLKWSIDAIKEKFNFSSSISLVNLPFWRSLVEQIEDTTLIYDCMDDHAGFENNSKEMLSEEEALMKESRLVITSSKKLFENAKLVNPDSILVKNGTDINSFVDLIDNEKLKHIKKPIIGYYGAIAEWFDLELVEFCAKKRPDYNFVLIGHVSGLDISEITKLPNVHFLGEKPYKEIPDFLYHFDVCLIPFKIIPLTLATNPVKFYEYISSGKPVVSVDLPELDQYKDISYVSSDKEDFLGNIDKALLEEKDAVVEKRMAEAKLNTWEQRADMILEYINKYIFPKISIVMITYNNIDYTKSCLASIFKKTNYPNYEIIIVDNKSSDGTQEYLKEIESKNINVKIILNIENRGFAGGNNDGLRLATGEYLVLLNNDTIVSENWLLKMKKIIDSSKKLGMLGPVSNSVGNIQMIPVQYENVDQMDNWISENISERDLGYYDMQMLGFFCVMMKREVYEKIGDLDENFGVGMFEDDDYCERIKNGGFNLGYTDNVFIHHFGSVSFKKLEDEKYKAIWDKNKEYFEKKWNKKWQASLDKKNAKIIVDEENTSL